MPRFASLLFALLVAPASAFHDSNLDARLKATLDQMMRSDPARAQMFQQQGNMLAAMQERCQRGDRDACTRFEQGAQEVRQWARQTGDGNESPSRGGPTPAPKGPFPKGQGAASPSQAGKGPTPVSLVPGNRCNALAPQGWRVVDESREGDGVDFASSDVTLGASYLILGVPALMLPTYGGTPEAAARFVLSKFGRMPTRFGTSQNTETGFKALSWSNQTGRGLSLWYTFPLAQGAPGFVLVIRTGIVAPQGNEQRLREAVAVATSIRCNVALRPPPPADWTGGKTPGRKKPRSDDEAASDYNKQLGVENLHDKTTGRNYTATPSDFKYGPEGLGVYIEVGNEKRKLAPGRSD